MFTADEHLKFVSLRNRKTKSTNDMTENLRAASGPPADPSADPKQTHLDRKTHSETLSVVDWTPQSLDPNMTEAV